MRKRGKGPTQNPKINAAQNPKKFLGVTRFGFSKQNEVLFIPLSTDTFITSMNTETAAGINFVKMLPDSAIIAGLCGKDSAARLPGRYVGQFLMHLQ